MTSSVRLHVLTVAIAVLVRAASASAHPAPYSYVDLRFEAGRLSATLVIHAFDAAYELGSESPEAALEALRDEEQGRRLAALLAPRFELRADDVALTLRWTSVAVVPDRQSVRLAFDAPVARIADVTLTAVPFPYDPQHQVFVNIYRDGALAHQAILDASHATMTWSTSAVRRATQVLRTFIPEGIRHILIGPDHVLFVIALLLAGGAWRRLCLIITAFTVGHSVTLGLATLDLVRPSSAIIEPAIALSIVVVGVDNLLGAGAAERRDLRAWAAGAFGLLHGFGFASVLRDMALPGAGAGLAYALAGFNVGVEIGQLAIVAVVAVPLALMRHYHDAVAERVVYVASLCVVAAGGWWFVERTFLAGGV